MLPGKAQKQGNKGSKPKSHTKTFHAHMVVVRWSFYLISKIHVCCTRQPDSGKFTRLLGNKDRERHGDGDMVCWFGGKSASHTQCNNQLTERFHTRNGSNTLNNLLVRVYGVYVRRIIVDRSAGWKVRYCKVFLWQENAVEVRTGCGCGRSSAFANPFTRLAKVESLLPYFPLDILMQLYKNMRFER